MRNTAVTSSAAAAPARRLPGGRSGRCGPRHRRTGTLHPGSGDRLKHDRRADHQLRRRLRRHGPQHHGHRPNGSIGVFATGPPVHPHHERHHPEPHRPALGRRDPHRHGVGLRGRGRRRRAERRRAHLDPTSGITTGSTIRDSVFRENTGAGIRPRLPGRGDHGRAVPGHRERRRARRPSTRGGSTAPRTASTAATSRGTRAPASSSTGAISREIDNCTIRGNGGDGLRISESYTNITGNRVENNGGTGVNAGDRSSSTITGNRITGNGLGVATDTEFGFRVWNNVLNNTATAASRTSGAWASSTPRRPPARTSSAARSSAATSGPSRTARASPRRTPT